MAIITTVVDVCQLLLLYDIGLFYFGRIPLQNFPKFCIRVLNGSLTTQENDMAHSVGADVMMVSGAVLKAPI